MLFSWVIERIQNFQKEIKSKDHNNNELSQQIGRVNREIEELSKDKERLQTAWTFIYVMWREWYQEYVEKHKTSIAKIIKAHYEKNTLTWENRDVIIQDIVEDMEKVNGAQIPEMKYIDTVLIHFLLYNKRDALSDLIGTDKKKITLEWKD